MFSSLARSTAPLLVVLGSVGLAATACGGTDAAPAASVAAPSSSAVESSGPAVESSMADEASPEAMASDDVASIAEVTDGTYGYQAWAADFSVNLYLTNNTAETVAFDQFAFDLDNMSATLEDGSTIKASGVACGTKNEIAPGDYITCFMSGFDFLDTTNLPVFVTFDFLSTVDGTPVSVQVNNDPSSAPEWRQQ
jgi:hypothetical protein